jgi:hypothetical protein
MNRFFLWIGIRAPSVESPDRQGGVVATPSLTVGALQGLPLLAGELGQQESRRVLGHLFTTWSGRRDALAEYPPLVEGLKLLRAAGD